MDPGPLDVSAIVGHAPAVLLVLARVSGVCLTAPVIAVPGADWRVRILLAAFLGAVLVPVIEPIAGSLPAGPRLEWMIAGEVLAGGLLGRSAGLIVAAARQAGELVAAQAGLSAASLFDPEADLELTALGHLYGLIALAVFLALGGPLVLVAALIESYRALPAGALSLTTATASEVFGQVGSALALSLRVAAPPAIALAVAGIVMGWIGRLAPAVPVLALSLPVRAMLAIVFILLSAGALAATLAQAWASWPLGS